MRIARVFSCKFGGLIILLIWWNHTNVIAYESGERFRLIWLHRINGKQGKVNKVYMFLGPRKLGGRVMIE